MKRIEAVSLRERLLRMTTTTISAKAEYDLMRFCKRVAEVADETVALERELVEKNKLKVDDKGQISKEQAGFDRFAEQQKALFGEEVAVERKSFEFDELKQLFDENKVDIGTRMFLSPVLLKEEQPDEEQAETKPKGK